MPCPDESALLRWVDGERSTRDDELRRHLDGCESCRAIVVELMQSTEGPAGPPDHASRIGRFIVLEPLGVGAMGLVYSAYDPQLDRRVALKLVKVAPGTDPEAQARLLREARAGAALNHPNVVTIFDAGLHHGELFIAMELVDGGSLREWLREPRSWREIVRVFVDAGRGLSAAHRAGWVHRDFKPENVLLGKSGRVLISDFGLASVQSAAASSPSGGADGELGSQLAVLETRTGTLVGSPAYMAPELAEGVPAGSASDQFSFCVALFEALTGIRPFAGGTVEAVFAEAKAGRIRSVPQGLHLPAALLRVVRRGLQASPSARFSSVEELVKALEAVPRTRSRRRIGALAATTVLGVATAGWFLSAEHLQPCADAEHALGGFWDPARQTQIREAFYKANPALAESAWEGVSATLGEFAQGFAREARDNCEATRVRGEQSETLLDLRTQCLQRRLGEARAVAELFTRADARVVERAISAARSLRIDGCSAAAVQSTTTPPPADPAARQKYDALITRIADGKAQFSAGRLEEARTVFLGLLPELESVGLPSLRIETLYELGKTEQALGLEEAEQSLSSAHYLSLEKGAESFAAKSALMLTRVLVWAQRPVEARHFHRTASALVQHLPPNPELRTTVALEAATVATSEGKAPSEVLELLKTALEHARAAGPSARDLEAAALNDLGNVHYELGDFRAAREKYEQATDIMRDLFGRDHPRVSTLRYNIAGTYRLLGDFKAAHAALDEALEIWTRAAGPHNSMTGTILGGKSVTFREEGRLKEAEAYARRSVESRIKVSGESSKTAAVGLSNLAQILIDAGRPEEAREPGEKALAVFTQLNDAEGRAFCVELLGTVALKAGRHQEAILRFEESLTLWGRLTTDPRRSAAVKFYLAQALWDSKRDRRRAVALAKEALLAYPEATGYDATNRKEVEAWLAAHRR